MRKLPPFIALLCILVYVGAVLQAAYRIYTSIEDQRQKAGQELDEMGVLIAGSGSGFFSEPFREQIRAKIASNQALEGIIITGSGGNLEFEKEPGTLITRDGGSPRFIPRFGYISTGGRQVDIPGFRNVNIYPRINVVNYENLIFILRQTLLLILAALLLSFLTMIISFLRSGKTKETPFKADNTAAGQAPSNQSSEDDYSDLFVPEEPMEEFTKPSAEEPLEQFTEHSEEESMEQSAGYPGEQSLEDISFDTPVMETDGETSETGTDDGDFELPDFDDLTEDSSGAETDSDDFHLDDFLDENDLELPLPESPMDTGGAVPASIGEVEELSGSGEAEGAFSSPASGAPLPSGLYSPRSGIGWEAYTQERLASELHRCAASEQDLVVLLMECGEGVNCDGTLYKKLGREAVEFFNLQDLSFERGDRGMAVIIPNTDLEHGIMKAEEFHSRILKNYYDSFHAKSDFVAGLSSRSGRLIEADRLLVEAGTALTKAKEEAGSPIMAFKSDPEKYREFVRKGRDL